MQSTLWHGLAACFIVSLLSRVELAWAHGFRELRFSTRASTSRRAYSLWRRRPETGPMSPRDSRRAKVRGWIPPNIRHTSAVLSSSGEAWSWAAAGLKFPLGTTLPAERVPRRAGAIAGLSFMASRWCSRRVGTGSVVPHYFRERFERLFSPWEPFLLSLDLGRIATGSSGATSGVSPVEAAPSSAGSSSCVASDS